MLILNHVTKAGLEYLHLMLEANVCGLWDVFYQELINIVLAAGYATRLGELTKNFPKPLLKIGNSTILGRMLDDIDNIDDITEHVIVTNHRFAPMFEEWIQTPIGSPCLGGGTDRSGW